MVSYSYFFLIFFFWFGFCGFFHYLEKGVAEEVLVRQTKLSFSQDTLSSGRLGG